MASGSGSTVGPDGQLYVTEGAAGRVLRVNPRTGHVTTFASGLPRSIIGIGGAMDVAFIGETAYVLVTLVGSDVGGSDKDGIYRVDGPHSFTVIADIGAFSIANPPKTDFFIPTGLQYAMERYRGGFLVTDGHHNRVLRVRLNGQITEAMTFANVVPTGLAIRGRKVYVSQAGPVPHEPQNGKIVSFRLKSESPTVHEVASGARLLTDVQFRAGTLYGLAGRVPGRRPAWQSGNAEHRQPRAGHRGRHVQGCRDRTEPTDLTRVHREHRVRRDARRGNLEDSRRVGRRLRNPKRA